MRFCDDLFVCILFRLCSNSSDAGESYTAGQRRNVCGMKKSTMFVADFAATELVQFVLACALLIYMRFVLNLQIGERYAAIVLLLFVGTSFGIVFGMLIGSIAHLSQGGKNRSLSRQ